MVAAGGSYFATPSGAGMDIDTNTDALLGNRQLKRYATVETSGTSGKKRRVTLRATSQHSALSVANTREEDSLYDRHLLANMGPQRLTGLSMRIGSRLGRLDNFGRFLKNLQQNGRINVGWNGTVKGGIDTRNVHMQVFRHRMSKNSANIVQDAYPILGINGGPPSSQVLPMYLYPSNSLYLNSTQNAYDLTNPFTPGAVGLTNQFPFQEAPAPGDVVKNAYLQHPVGTVAWAVMNRPDLEDMSWNLNKLKLRANAFGDASQGDGLNQPLFTGITQQGTGTFTGDLALIDTSGATASYTPTGTLTIEPIEPEGSVYNPRFLPDVAVFQIDQHRRQSVLQQNNFLASASPVNMLASGAISEDSTLYGYTYDAVLRYGKIAYDFMNKNDTAAVVQVIIYRVKKTAKLSSDASVYINQNPDSILPPDTPGGQTAIDYPLNMLVSSIGQGYVDTVGDTYATENFQGRKPLYGDIYDNPDFPLFPQLKKTIESQNPFVEVMRNKFVMPAGSRRSLDVHLPGLVYDPAEMPTLQGESAESHVGLELASSAIPIVDQYSYAAVIACNGQKMTRFFDAKPISAGHTAAGIIRTFQLNAQSFAVPSVILNPSQGFTSAKTYFIQVPNGFGGVAVLGIVVTELTGANLNTVEPNFAGWTFGVILPWVYTGPTANCYLVSPGANFTVSTISIPDPSGGIVPPYNPLQFVTTTSTGAAAIAISLQILSVTDAADHPAQLPSELPMGDNHGSFHVDYCANYSEHIGACIYKSVKERNLYDCGQPLTPVLDTSASLPPFSTTGSRMILPATSVVRQAQRAVIGIGADGATTTVDIQKEAGG